MSLWCNNWYGIVKNLYIENIMVIDFLFQIEKPLDKYKFKQFFSVELKKKFKNKWQPQGYSVHSVVKLEILKFKAF